MFRVGSIGVMFALAVCVSAAEVEKRSQGRKQLPAGIEPAEQHVVDWPTYMHDNHRSGTTAASLSLPLKGQWTYQPRKAPEPAWPPPAKADLFHKKFTVPPRVTYDRAYHVVAVADRVYFGSSADDKVYCLDANTGREVWTFYTEGPVRLAPTIADNGQKVLVGSDDGYVYCLKAADGSLLWKIRLAERDVRIAGNGRVISLWPVRTGVAVVDNVGHFCAGLWPNQGVYYGTVDIRTGKRLARKQIRESAQGYLQVQGDKLFCPTGRRPKGASLGQLARRGKVRGAARQQILTEYPYATIGTKSLRFAGGDGRVAAFGADGAEKLWSAEVRGKAYSLAVAGGRLLVGTDQGMIYCFGPAKAKGIDVKPPATKAGPYGQDAAQKPYADAAKTIIEKSGIRKGYCLVLGSARGRLAYELAKRTELTIVCVEPDAKNAAESRKALDAAGLYGRVVVHHGRLDKLPYTDYLFNLVVHGALAAGKPFAGSRPEALRVLRPCGGVAMFSLDEQGIVRRGPLKGQGEWSHLYAGPGNTACSGDLLTQGDMTVQWFGRPGPVKMVDRHNRGVAPLYKNGRVFMSGNNYITAMDAYNGTVLWEQDLGDSVRAAAPKNCGNMAATDERLYVAAGKDCLALDAQTGRKARTFAVPADNTDWGYVACVGNALLGSATRPGASRWKFSPSSWQIAYGGGQPVICSDSLFAYDRRTGARLWTYTGGKGVIINPAIAAAPPASSTFRLRQGFGGQAGQGQVYFVQSANAETRKIASGRVKQDALLGQGADLVALDVATGKILWRSPVSLEMRHTIFLSCAKGVLLLTGSKTVVVNKKKRTRYDLHAFAAETGKPLWQITHVPTKDGAIGGSHGELTQHPAIVGETIYIYQSAYHLRTGKLVANWNWKRNGGGCGTFSTSALSLFARGTTVKMTDLKTGKHSSLTGASRPGCWINIIPAGGLVIVPEASSGCTCPFPIQTSLALRPVRH